MAVVLEIIDLVVCWKIHGCGCVADNLLASKSAISDFHTLYLPTLCLPGLLQSKATIALRPMPHCLVGREHIL
jgi:hypothetical protein